MVENARIPEDQPKPRRKRVLTENQMPSVGKKMKYWKGRHRRKNHTHQKSWVHCLPNSKGKI